MTIKTPDYEEIRAMISASYKTAAGSERRRQVIDDILALLTLAYRDGVQAAGEMLDFSPDAFPREMEEAIYHLIDGKTFADRAADHIEAENEAELQTLAASEYHRVYNAAIQDGGNQYAKKTGQEVSKVWYTMMDDKVRDSHAYLNWMQVGLNEAFFTWDGDSALYPGDFALAENNCGCRCFVLLRPYATGSA